jgi:hypothetical protein
VKKPFSGDSFESHVSAYRFFLRIWRLILVIVVLVLFLFGAFLYFSKTTSFSRSNDSPTPQSQIPKVCPKREEAQGLRYQGVHKKGGYILEARSGKRKPGDKILLKKITGKIKTPHAETIFKGNESLYEPGCKKVTVKGQIRLQTSTGYNIKTPAVRVSTDSQTIRGNCLTKGHGPLGSFSSNAFEVRDGGDKIILKDQPRLVIYGQ